MTKKEIYEQVVELTAKLAQTKVAERIFGAATEGNVAKTQQIIDSFPENYPELSQKIVSFGQKFNKFVTAYEADELEIFGKEADEANGVFVFDTSIIDVLSFYVLNILGHMNEVYFFYGENGYFADRYFSAIFEATNEAFRNFVQDCSMLDCISTKTVGEVLVEVLADDFEEPEDEETEP